MKTVTTTGRRSATALTRARAIARSIRRGDGRARSRGFTSDNVDGLGHLQQLLPR